MMAFINKKNAVDEEAHKESKVGSPFQILRIITAA